MEQVYLAVEGGGSKSRAALEHRGRISARVERAGLNPRDIGLAAFPRRLGAVISPLLAGLPRDPVAIYACCAVAGLGSPLIRASSEPGIRRILGRYGACRRLELMSDLDALVQVCLAERDGLVLIAGTGSVCAGVRHADAGAVRARVGGEGGALDRGSGYWVGLNVLRQAARFRDGRARRSRALELAARRLGVPAEEVADRLVTRNREEVSRLVPDVLQACVEGDPFAGRTVERAVFHLVRAAARTKAVAGLSGRFDVHVAGGLFESPVVLDLFRRRLASVAPLAMIRRAPEPLMGALQIARSLAAAPAR